MGLLFEADGTASFDGAADPAPLLYEANGTSSTTSSDVVNVQGTAGIVPGITAVPQGSSTSGGSPFSAISDILGNLRKYARDAGSLVGTVQHDLNAAPGDYNTARQNALAGNKIGQLFQYSTPMEKTMLIVALGGLAIAAMSYFKMGES